MGNEKLNNGVIDLEGEVWKVINHPSIGDYSNYEISNFGRVKSRRGNKERILKPIKGSANYLSVVLCKNGRNKMYLIHRLEAIMFIPTPNPDNPLEVNNLQVNHLDEIKTNNKLENLEWCTQQYNVTYGTFIERRKETLKNSTAWKEGMKKRAPKQSKKVYQYDQNFNLLKIYKSLKDVFNQTGLYICHIKDVCQGKKDTAYGFIWSYEPLTETKVS